MQFNQSTHRRVHPPSKPTCPAHAQWADLRPAPAPPHRRAWRAWPPAVPARRIRHGVAGRDGSGTGARAARGCRGRQQPVADQGPGRGRCARRRPAAAGLLRFGGAEPGHENRCCISCAPTPRARAARWETQDRGIILNLAETTPSRWTKGVMPDVPVWLNAYLPCTPYDPASAGEARAILRGALQACMWTVTPAALPDAAWR